MRETNTRTHVAMTAPECASLHYSLLSMSTLRDRSLREREREKEREREREGRGSLLAVLRFTL